MLEENAADSLKRFAAAGVKSRIRTIISEESRGNYLLQELSGWLKGKLSHVRC
jgi:hypothetical protein